MSSTAKPVGRAKNKIVKICELGKKIQYPAKPTLEDRVEVIQSFLEKDLIYWDIKRTVKEAIFSPDFNVATLREDVTSLLDEAKLATGLKNAVYLYDKQAKASLGKAPSRGAPVPPVPVLEEPIEAVQAARVAWDNRLRYELRSVAAKQKRKLVRLRDFHDKDDNDYLIRFVYTSEDLLETITNIQNSNISTSMGQMAGWGLIKMELNTPSLHALRNKYKELTPGVRQIGVDDTVLGCEWFAAEQLQLGEKLIQEAYIPILREYAKTGVPPSLRPMLWCKCLGVELTQQELHYFECLLAQVQQWDLITDDLTRFDVQDCSDSDEFFVFEEVLDEVMLAFTRDPEVPKMASITTTTAVLNKGKQPAKVGQAATKLSNDTVPPCTIIPYHRQVMFAAPLGYLFYRADEAYFLFRALYCRYFVRLSVISSQPDTIMYLCKMFENVMQLRAPDAFYHAVKVGTHPLSLAFPWMFSAFSGWLEVEQVLLLWDRILAYDSLELLALLAAAIFLFRAKSVMEATTPEDIQGIFREMSNLKVVPLLQQFLFAPSNI